MLLKYLTLGCCLGLGSQTVAEDAQSGHDRMVALLAEYAVRRPYGFDYAGEVRQLRSLLAAIPDDAPLTQRVDILSGLAASEFEAGMPGAVERLQLAHELASRFDEATRRRYLLPISYHLGVMHYREARRMVCVIQRAAKSCVLPIGETTAITPTARTSLLTAMRYLQYVITETPDNAPRHLTAKWLMNLAGMMIGSNSLLVPERFRLAPDAFSASDFPFFGDVGAETGLDAAGYAGGLIAEDFDGDGNLDILVSSVHANYQMRLFRNGGNGKFVDMTQTSGLTGIFGGLHMVQADYDNDGDADVLVVRGAWLGTDGQIPNSLLRNNGDLTFTDVTFESGIGEHHYPTQAMTWLDYDNDGNLDLYIANESSPALRSPSQLFRNDGKGRFQDVAAEAKVQNFGFAKGVSAGDFNNDGFPDLFVSNMNQENRLYRNNADGTFTDVARELGTTGPVSSFSSWFWDVDNNGTHDLMVTSYPIEGPAHPLADVASVYMGQQSNLEGPELYLNDGRNHLTPAAAEYGIAKPILTMGSNFGDLDNDGFLEYYLGTGYMTYEAVMPNIMYHNLNGKRFEDVSYRGGFGQLAKGHGIAFADLDNDGDQDVITRLGGAFLHDISYDSLHENPGFNNQWITLKLVGSQSNRGAIGARIRIDIEEGDQSRSIFRTVDTGSSFGANPMRREIGLGAAKRIERLEVHWPTSKTTQTFTGLDVNQFIQITEGQADIKKLRRKSFRLGGNSDTSP